MTHLLKPLEEQEERKKMDERMCIKVILSNIQQVKAGI